MTKGGDPTGCKAPGPSRRYLSAPQTQPQLPTLLSSQRAEGTKSKQQPASPEGSALPRGISMGKPWRADEEQRAWPALSCCAFRLPQGNGEFS